MDIINVIRRKAVNMADIRISKTEFEKLYMDLTVKQLAEKLGVKPNQVSKVAKQLGLKKQKGQHKDRNILILE